MSNLSNLVGLVPIVLFLLATLVVSFFIRSRSRKSGGGFVKEYFIGNRALGGFVLAMTTIATYGSVSSFVGGPGQAWEIGFGWVYMAAVQVTTLFLLYGIMGKKMALVSRKLGAVTIIDVIRARYKSNAIAALSAVIIVLFFAATMVAQFVGGAKLFEAVTGYSYIVGLCLFGIVVIIFTTVGGFRGVAVTDAMCGVAMLVGIAVLAGGILDEAGGYEAIMNTIASNHPEMLEPLSDGNMPLTLYFTQWLLVGVFTFALPQSLVRCMGFKDTKSLHQAMILGTVIMGAMIIGVTTLGVLSAGVLTDDLSAYGDSVDNIIPQVIVQTLPSWLAGIAIIGPIAASISTVSSLLIAASSAIIKDLWLHYAGENKQDVTEKSVSRTSLIITLIIGAIVFVLSVVPPDVIWRINMFAFGGLETAFCWTFLAAFFWKRANRCGVLLGMAGGVVVYCITMGLGITFFGMHQIVIGITVSFVLTVIGSLIGKPVDSEVLEVFFPSASESLSKTSETSKTSEMA